MLQDLRVLVVEDGKDELEMYSFALARAGAEVVAATSAEDAIMLAGARDFDVLVSDISLPGMDGLEMLRYLRASGVAAPAIALTGWSGSHGRDEATAAGFDEHCPKPCTPTMLIEAIRRLVIARP